MHSGTRFLQSTKAVAQKEHDDLLKVMEDKRTGVKFARAQLELVTAKKHVSPRLEELPDQWAKDHHVTVIREKKDGGNGKKATVFTLRGKLERKPHNTLPRRLGQIRQIHRNALSGGEEHGRNYCRPSGGVYEEHHAEKLSDRTWNYHLVLLREMYERHEPDTSACEYLRETEEREEERRRSGSGPDGLA